MSAGGAGLGKRRPRGRPLAAARSCTSFGFVGGIVAVHQQKMGIDPQSLCNSLDVVDRDVALAPLDSAEICRSEEHTSELQSLMRISYAVFCLKKKQIKQNHSHTTMKHIRYSLHTFTQKHCTSDA